MLKKAVFCAVIFSFFLYAPTQPATAAQSLFDLELQLVSVTPVFLSGQEGNMAMVEGFTGDLQVYFNDELIGSVTLTAILQSPPMQFTTTYDAFLVEGELSLTGIGALQMRGAGIAMGEASVQPPLGDVIMTFSVRAYNGTDAFTGWYGVGGGTGAVNVFTGQGVIPFTLGLQPGL